MNQEKDSYLKYNMATIKRQTAKKLFIMDILQGEYIKRSGWEPSGVLTKYGEASRVNILGVVVSVSAEDNNNNSLLVDDGTGTILIRSFEPLKTQVELGTLVKIIGRARQGGSNKYIVPEIILSIKEKKWHKIHQMQIKLQKKLTILPEDNKEVVENVETGPYQKILNIISILDKGSGADIQEIVSNIKVDHCEDVISSLIEEGEIFEISPGKVKLLE